MSLRRQLSDIFFFPMASMSQIASSSSSSPSPLPSKLDSPESEANSGAGPWPDLPDYLAENILERLPISDYISFAAVCQQWRSIQQDNRRRHAPSPPPMLNLPWFVPCFQDEEEEAAPYFSPFEKQRSRRLRALSRAKKPFPSHLYASFPCGWLMKDDSRSSPPSLRRFYLLNPVTGDEIQIPPIERPLNTYRAAMSPPPGWSLFVIAKRMSGSSLLFLRRGDPDWIRPSSPHDREHAPVESMTNIIFCGGKFWYLSQEDTPFSFLLPPPHPRGMRLFALDPLPAARQPAVCFVEMDRSELPTMGDKLELFLVESDGEVLLVVEILEDGPVRSILDIHLFRADLSKKMWVRMHGLGDRVLILHVKCSASFLAADLGVPGNHVYCSGSTPWQVFDLGARRLTDESPAFPSSFAHLMFVPSIC